MSKKPSLAEQLGQRRQQSQQPVVEPVKPEDPIAAVTASLHPPPADAQTVAKEETRELPEPSTEKRVRTRTHTRTQTRGGAEAEVVSGGIDIETLYRKLQARKHLSSYTFRFRAEELDEIDQIATELEQEDPGRFSKNDLARLALLWLCEDYRKNGEASILEQVHKRM
jgi:hypothetical protein